MVHSLAHWKRFVWVLPALTLLLTAFAARAPKGQGITSPSPTASVSPAVFPSSTPAPIVSGATDERAVAAKVIDGDTIVLADGRAVRYIGIDAPETRHPQRGIECFGREATERNRLLTEGKTVRLKKDVSETDRYERLLRYVYVDEQLVNEVLVRDGFAVSSAYPPDLRYQDALRAAEREARSQRRGLFGTACTGRPPVEASSPAVVSGDRGQHSPEETTDRDCADFTSQTRAQQFFLQHGGPDSDPHRLDEDRDGRACESLP